MNLISTVLNLKQEEIDTIEKRGAYAVTIVGCGKEGLTYGIAFAEAGFKVTLTDQDQSLIKNLARGRSGFFEPEIENKFRTLCRTGGLKASNELANAVSLSDIIIITITPKIGERKSIDYSEIEKTCKQVGTDLKRGVLVIYAGVAGLGFMENVVKEALSNASGLRAGVDFGIAYSSILTFNAPVTLDLITNLEVIVGAGDKNSISAASLIFASITKRAVRQAMTFEVAELAKLFSAVRRDANLALTNEFAILCESAGIDYLKILEVMDSQLPFSTLLPTIMGDFRKEVYMLIESAESLNIKLRITALARQLNEDMVRRAVHLTHNALRSCGKTLRRSKITVFGEFSPGTPGETFVTMLDAKGAKTSVFDPLMISSEARTMEKPKRNVIDAAEGSDCLVFMQEREFAKNLNLRNLWNVMRSPAAIIDLGKNLEPEKVEREGFIYRGLGRGTGKK